MNRSVLALLLVAGASSSAFAQFRGVSTSVNPYLLPTVPGVSTYSILTVNDPGSLALNVPAGGIAGNGYVMCGTPDGMGAYSTSASTFGLVSNHEFANTAGVARAHGGTGAFVSQWSISNTFSGPDAFRVHTGRDLTSAGQVSLYNSGTGTFAPAAPADPLNRFNRLCSGDLVPATGIYNPLTGNGTTERLYMAGEEAGTEGRNFGWVVGGANNGLTQQLPRLGRASIENVLINPYQNHDRTTAMIMNDGTAVTFNPQNVLIGGAVNYMYSGTRTNQGNAFERAGLNNGNLYTPTLTVNNTPVTIEHPTFAFGTSSLVTSARFGFANLGDVSNMTGAAIDAAAVAAGGFRMSRTEDGAWDTRAGFESDYYCVTTASATGQSRLWRQRFDDITNPTAGGQMDMLWQSSDPLANGINGLAGTTAGQSPSGVRMMDNMCLDRHGHIFITEDVGNNSILGRILMFDLATSIMSVVAQFDPTLFTTGLPGFLTQDEEASGIIDAEDILGAGWLIVNVQAHYGIAGERVEGGQFIAIHVPTPGAAGLLALGTIIASRRRRA